jgi:hypothetical protein
MRIDQEEEVVVEDHLEEEGEAEDDKPSTNQILNVTDVTSSDISNMSVLV